MSRIIRPAAAPDVSEIAALVDDHAQRGDVLPRSVATIRDSLTEWLVAEEDGEVLGCVSLLYYGAQLAEVRTLVVDDRVKGNGWGKALIDAVIAEAHRREIPTLFALTRAVPVFLRCGFHVTDKDSFPEKVWRDCRSCPKIDCCDEAAVVLDLRRSGLRR